MLHLDIERELFLQQLPRRQILHKSAVGGQKFVLGQILEPHPTHLLINSIVDFARKRAHREELQVHGAAAAIVVADACDCGTDFGAYAKLLSQFAAEGLLRAFAWLDLPARKLP